MPVIQQFDPMTAASDAIGAYSDQKRTNELQAKAEAYRASRDQRTDSNADRTYGLQQGEAADRHAQTQQSISSQQQSDAITQEQHAYEVKMEPLKTAAAQIQNKLVNGELVTAADRHKLAQIELSDSQFKAYLDRKYGEAGAQQGLVQGAAGIAATQAGTAATQFGTQRGEAMLPGEMQGQGLENQGRALQNVGTQAQNAYDELRNKYAPKLLQNELDASNAKATSGEDKAADADYRAQLQSFSRKSGDFKKAVASGKVVKNKDGTGFVDHAGTPVAPPVEPMSPGDFQATVGDTLDAIEDPSKRGANGTTLPSRQYATKALAAIDADPRMTSAQKRKMTLAITAMLKKLPPDPAPTADTMGGALNLGRGGSKDAAPFLGSLGL